MKISSISCRRAVIAALCTLAGCAQQSPKPLYMWEGYSRLQFKALSGSAEGPLEQIRAMEAHADKARGANAALPPGFRAHLGMLHLVNGNAAAARAAWEAEKLAFPESADYLDQLLKRLDGAAKPEKESPA